MICILSNAIQLPLTDGIDYPIFTVPGMSELKIFLLITAVFSLALIPLFFAGK